MKAITSTDGGRTWNATPQLLLGYNTSAFPAYDGAAKVTANKPIALSSGQWLLPFCAFESLVLSILPCHHAFCFTFHFARPPVVLPFFLHSTTSFHRTDPRGAFMCLYAQQLILIDSFAVFIFLRVQLALGIRHR